MVIEITIDDVKTAKQAGSFYYTSPSNKRGGKSKKLWNLWVDISMEEIDNASNYKEARDAWEDAPTMSFVKCEALKKMLSFADDGKRITAIISCTPRDSMAYYLAVKKLNNLHKK
ncbi:hypothetical protein COB64_03225 [Candidatus Wolfebacteria bacterium]|nr:MAG: hypothetical protein COB64_03225 [Candidatus Wolfebacteria bacterium]